MVTTEEASDAKILLEWLWKYIAEWMNIAFPIKEKIVHIEKTLPNEESDKQYLLIKYNFKI